jgi:hypothetical protein
MQVSSQLQSQLFPKYTVAAVLKQLGRTNWENKYSEHNLTVEAWAVGIWVKEAGTIISYRELNKYTRFASAEIASQLPVEKVKGGWWVQSRQCSDKYFVTASKTTGWSCSCMKFRCWRNRMPNELPMFWKVIDGHPYCHHIVAAYLHNQATH